VNWNIDDRNEYYAIFARRGFTEELKRSGPGRENSDAVQRSLIVCYFFDRIKHKYFFHSIKGESSIPLYKALAGY